MTVQAAGLMLLYRHPSGDRVLLLRRSSRAGDHIGEWCFPGGELLAGETALEGAERETLEEVGTVPYSTPREWTRQVRDGVDFTTFLAYSESEFKPRLSEEHDAYVWSNVDALIGEERTRNPPMESIVR